MSYGKAPTHPKQGNRDWGASMTSAGRARHGLSSPQRYIPVPRASPIRVRSNGQPNDWRTAACIIIMYNNNNVWLPIRLNLKRRLKQGRHPETSTGLCATALYFRTRADASIVILHCRYLCPVLAGRGSGQAQMPGILSATGLRSIKKFLTSFF